jgi:hypothetical protein
MFSFFNTDFISLFASKLKFKYSSYFFRQMDTQQGKSVLNTLLFNTVFYMVLKNPSFKHIRFTGWK